MNLANHRLRLLTALISAPLILVREAIGGVQKREDFPRGPRGWRRVNMHTLSAHNATISRNYSHAAQVGLGDQPVMAAHFTENIKARFELF